MKTLPFCFRVTRFSQAHIYHSSIHVSSAHWLANLTQEYIMAFLHSCAFRLPAKVRQSRHLSESNKTKAEAQEGEPVWVLGPDPVPHCGTVALQTCCSAIYLSCHLPDTIDELEEDRRAICICVILISMANSLEQSTTKNMRCTEFHGEAAGGSSQSHKIAPTDPNRFKWVDFAPSVLVGEAVKDSYSLSLWSEIFLWWYFHVKLKRVVWVGLQMLRWHRFQLIAKVQRKKKLECFLLQLQLSSWLLQ